MPPVGLVIYGESPVISPIWIDKQSHPDSQQPAKMCFARVACVAAAGMDDSKEMLGDYKVDTL